MLQFDVRRNLPRDIGNQIVQIFVDRSVPLGTKHPRTILFPSQSQQEAILKQCVQPAGVGESV